MTLKNWILNRLDDYEKMQNYALATDTVRCWIDEWEKLRPELILVTELEGDGEDNVLGIADSLENAENLISQYFGLYEELSHRDIRDSGLLCKKVVSWYALGKVGKSTINFQSYKINEL